MKKITLSALIFAAAIALAAAAPAKPNVLVIVADDMGYADIGVQGCKDIPTPNIDSIARNGVRFKSGYVSCPVCSPTRAGLMTGRYQQRFGHEMNPKGPPSDENINHGLAVTETTFADRMKAAGYATGMVGKWHLGHRDDMRPQRRGYDDFFGFLGGSHNYTPPLAPEDVNAIRRGDTPITETEYLTTAFGREACAFIERHKEQPWYLYLPFNAVHTPMQAEEATLKKFAGVENTKRRTYCAMQSEMDTQIGRVLAKLRELKLEENTLVFFISDNGGPESKNFSDNGPLRGQKNLTWEGGIRVPFLVQWKARIPPGQVLDEPAIQLDFLPTALAAAGVIAKPEWKLDGLNLLPLLEGKTKSLGREALYWRYGTQFAIRQGDWKLVQALDEMKPSLINLKDDLGETTDLSAKNPAKVKELQSAWDKWSATLAPRAWGGEWIGKEPADAPAGKKGKKAKAASKTKSESKTGEE